MTKSYFPGGLGGFLKPAVGVFMVFLFSFIVLLLLLWIYVFYSFETGFSDQRPPGLVVDRIVLLLFYSHILLWGAYSTYMM